MKNFRKAIAASVLTGIIILANATSYAGIIVHSAVATTDPCGESNIVTRSIDSLLSAAGITDPGTVCGIIVHS